MGVWRISIWFPADFCNIGPGDRAGWGEQRIDLPPSTGKHQISRG
jgi:hypothetical protein